MKKQEYQGFAGRKGGLALALYRGMNAKFRFLAPLALAAAFVATGCDESESVEADRYVDGTTVETDLGAFDVTLSSESGDASLGENAFVLRVAFPDPTDPEAEGKGVPNARIELDAWMPNADHAMYVEPSVTYLGDGEYLVAPVLLDQSGVWSLDFDIAVGETIDETASFVFSL